MNATPSPTHFEQDLIAQNRPLAHQAQSETAIKYPGNPYWSKSGKSAEAPSSVPNPPIPINVPDSVISDPHLIGALVDAIQEVGRQQRDELRQQVTDWLPQLPKMLAPTVDSYLEQVVPKIVKVEHPGRTLLLLVRYLTAAIVVSGLIMGGLLYGWLQAAKDRDAYAPNYWQHRYAIAKATAYGSVAQRRLLAEADTLYGSPAFPAELNRLESLTEARRQRYYLQLREQELSTPSRQRTKRLDK